MTYFQCTEGMNAEQKADFDWMLKQPPERSHLRRPKGAAALMGLLGAPPGRPGAGPQRKHGRPPARKQGAQS